MSGTSRVCLMPWEGMALQSRPEFGKRQLEYLGHVIGNGVLAIPHHRAVAMADYITPKTKKHLHAFLGATSYYRRFGSYRVLRTTPVSYLQLLPRQRLV